MHISRFGLGVCVALCAVFGLAVSTAAADPAQPPSAPKASPSPLPILPPANPPASEAPPPSTFFIDPLENSPSPTPSLTPSLAPGLTPGLAPLPSLPASASARAEPTVVDDTQHVALPEPPPPPKTWYGWQIAMADLSWMVGAGVALGTESPAGAATIAISGYLLGAPLIHVLNKQNANVGLSFAARALLPLAGLATGFLVATESDDDTTAPALVGAGAGVLLAMVVDIASIAQKPMQSAPAVHAAKNRHAPTVHLAPSIMVLPKQQSVGVMGTF